MTSQAGRLAEDFSPPIRWLSRCRCWSAPPPPPSRSGSPPGPAPASPCVACAPPPRWATWPTLVRPSGGVLPPRQRRLARSRPRATRALCRYLLRPPGHGAVDAEARRAAPVRTPHPPRRRPPPAARSPGAHREAHRHPGADAGRLARERSGATGREAGPGGTRRESRARMPGASPERGRAGFAGAESAATESRGVNAGLSAPSESPARRETG